jgi:SPP1 family predicted phage head-tail adaptor
MARDYTVDPGELTERVTLQSRSTAQDAYGQATITWTDVATVWARVRPVSGREFFAAAQVQQEQTVKVLVRYRTDVLPTWRLVWQGRAHDITGVLPIGREWTEILCLQGVKDGR